LSGDHLRPFGPTVTGNALHGFPGGFIAGLLGYGFSHSLNPTHIHEPSGPFAFNLPTGKPILQRIPDSPATNASPGVAPIDIIQFPIGVVNNDVGIREANHQNPVPTAPWSRGRTLVKEAYGYGKACFEPITKTLEGPVAVKDSPDVVISGCPHLCGWVGGVSVLKNGAEVVVVRVEPQKSLRPQVLDGHCTATGEAHPVRVGSTAVHLEKILRDVKNSVSHVILLLEAADFLLNFSQLSLDGPYSVVLLAEDLDLLGQALNDLNNVVPFDGKVRDQLIKNEQYQKGGCLIGQFDA
jgi:hypothetical protein